jgi:hypothetical protein
MPIGDRIRKFRRRRVGWGEEFTSDELDDDRVVLHLVKPALEQLSEQDQAEPWGTDKFPDRKRAYMEFLDRECPDRERP